MAHVIMTARGVINNVFNKYLLASNTIAGGVLFGLGDLSVQTMNRFVGERKHYDFHSTARLALFGLSMGPVMHFWYRGLDRVIPGKSLMITAKKILPDQLIASPFFIITFFMGVGTLEGKKLVHSYEELKSNFLFVYKIDWSFWPVAQFVNFTFVPSQYRVLYVCACTLVWDSFLVYIKQKDESDATTSGGDQKNQAQSQKTQKSQ